MIKNKSKPIKKPVKSKDKEEEKNIGRPTVMTKDVVEKLEEAFIMGCSDAEACILVGIDKTTLYNYCELHKSFSTKKELLKESPNLKARTIINKELDEGNGNTAKWYLERKKKDEFSTRSENVNTEKPYVTTEEDEEMAKEAAMKVWGLVENTNK